MGAGNLAIYNAKRGVNSKFDASVGISCAFDMNKAISHIQSHCFGFYDVAVGKTFTQYAGNYYQQFDNLAAKMHPERMVGNAANELRYGSEIAAVFAKAAGMTLEQYIQEAEVTPILHMIKKPFFFISSEDDPFFGKDVIPIGHCHENILLGVLKHGGHCCSIEGGLLPTACWWSKPSILFIEHYVKEALRAEETCDTDSQLLPESAKVKQNIGKFD